MPTTQDVAARPEPVPPAVDTAAAPAGAGPRFVLARVTAARAEEVNAFYNTFTGKTRSMAAYRWEFASAPGGPAIAWTITESGSGRFVGHHGLVPTPVLRRGEVVAAARTENTMVDRALRQKIFYPGMERRALAEARQALAVLYTVDATQPGPLRLRLGYRPIGRWTLFLARVEAGYLAALLRRARARLGVSVPDAVVGGLAGAAARGWALAGWRRRASVPAEVAEVADIDAIADEYERFWMQARPQYDTTIDRSLAFLRWRFRDNPYLRFRTWTVRRAGALRAVVVGHAHALWGATALFIDDIIVGQYDEAAFTDVLACLDRLDATAGAVVVMTLTNGTPLHRALRARFRWQAAAARRIGPRLFGEMMALEPDDAGGLWYVTPAFTEGLNTSR